MLKLKIKEGKMYGNISNLMDGEYIIKPYSPPRNNDQNRMYWALLGWVEKQTGNSNEFLHEMMKKAYLVKWRREKWMGKWRRVQVIGTTKTLSTKQFSKYYQQVELFFIENGVPPMPPIDSPEFLSLCEEYGK